MHSDLSVFFNCKSFFVLFVSFSSDFLPYKVRNLKKVRQELVEKRWKDLKDLLFDNGKEN